MATKFSLSFLFVWILSTSVTIAQSAIGKNVADHLLIKEANKNLGTDGIDDSVEGSPYLSDDFLEGKVYFDKGKLTVAPIRYNIYDDWLEYQQNNQTYILDPSERIKKVLVANEILVVERYLHKGKSKLGYFTLLDSGKIILLSKKMMTYRQRQEVKALESGATPAKYIRAADQYYYKLDNGELKKLGNLKDMIASLPENNEELTQFAKKEKISFKKEDELLKLVRYYNSLD